jgi:uroporphyrinogen decarboxylase
MNGKERVQRAIEFDCPDQLPIFATGDTDIVRLSYADPTGWVPRNRSRGDFEDEWGSLWYTGDDTMGSVKRPAIADISKSDEYVLPDPHLPQRWKNIDQQIEEHRNQYIVGNAQYLCFDRLTFLLGQIEALEALLIHKKKLARFMDRIIEFELGIIDELAQRGVDGIRFWDDVGASNGVIMGPKTWREVLAPYYQRVFTYIHEKDLHVHWHSCGNCIDIMEDLIGMGADVFSIGEPFMMGLGKLSGKFKGRVCFECSPDNRSVLSKSNKQEIDKAIAEMISALGTAKGGLILVAAEDNFDCLPANTRRIVIDAVLQAQSFGNLTNKRKDGIYAPN